MTHFFTKAKIRVSKKKFTSVWYSSVGPSLLIFQSSKKLIFLFEFTEYPLCAVGESKGHKDVLTLIYLQCGCKQCVIIDNFTNGAVSD